LLLILQIIYNSNLQKVIWFLGHGVLSIQTITVFNFFKDKFIRSGRPYFISTNGEDYSKNLKASIGPSRHYTMIFNVFVLM
jgi:hypothetical protein